MRIHVLTLAPFYNVCNTGFINFNKGHPVAPEFVLILPKKS